MARRWRWTGVWLAGTTIAVGALASSPVSAAGAASVAAGAALFARGSA